jgi:hypothetical protein
MAFEPVDPWEIVTKTYTRSESIFHFISRLIPRCIFKKSNDAIFTGINALKELNNFILDHPCKAPFSYIKKYSYGSKNSCHTLNLSDECIIVNMKLSMMYELNKCDLFISTDFQNNLRLALNEYCPSGFFFFDAEKQDDDNVFLNIYVTTKGL